MQEAVLFSRLSAGYDTDRFVFEVDGKRIKKFYGSRLTDAQAVSQLLIDLSRAGTRSGTGPAEAQIRPYPRFKAPG